ncbi:Alpha/Beta hydrolase protein [Spinellus fusiger]|nr:Alpha/Beta hydrolase protein [Spinellus fusiger]
MTTEAVFETNLTGVQANVNRTVPPLPSTWKHTYQQGFAPICTHDDHKTHFYYELHGTGPRKVVFLMGLNSSCQAWDYQTLYFGAMEEYTVLVFDARGVSWTGGYWDWYNTTDWAQDLFGLLDHLGWSQPIHAVGYSAGGQVLLKALLQSPPRFSSAVLMCTTAGGTRPWTGAYTLLSNMWQSHPKQQIERLIRINYRQEWLNARPKDTVAHENNFEMVYNKVLERNSRSRPQSLGGMLSQAVASLRHWVTASDLEKIKSTGIPLVVITNGCDNFVHTRHSLYLKEHLQPQQFVVFEDSGHVVPTAKHEELNELLHHFWSKL